MTRRPELDGIRAVAILLVLACHALVPGMKGGAVGVDVFFVLSGYLITNLLTGEVDRTGSINLPGFYLRRLRRLYPALLVMLLFFVVFGKLVFYISHTQWRYDTMLGMFYLMDYATEIGHPPAYLNHLWSLAVEEHFYLVWPLVVLGLSRLPRRAALLSLAGLFLIATAWRWYGQHWANDLQVYTRFDMRTSGLALGGLMSYLNHRAPEWVGWAGMLLVLACAIGIEPLSWTHLTWGITAAEIGAAALVVGAPISLGRMEWLGRMSYGLYLWHYPLARWSRDLALGPLSNLLISGLGGLALAAISYYTIESVYRRSINPKQLPQMADMSAPT